MYFNGLKKKCIGEKETWIICCLATAEYLKAKAIKALEKFVVYLARKINDLFLLVLLATMDASHFSS